jgi:hypothetical protein
VALDEVPLTGMVCPGLWELVVEQDRARYPRINRINYAIYVPQALHEGVLCKEMWVEGANCYRNPDMVILPANYAPRMVAVSR